MQRHLLEFVLQETALISVQSYEDYHGSVYLWHISYVVCSNIALRALTYLDSMSDFLCACSSVSLLRVVLLGFYMTNGQYDCFAGFLVWLKTQHVEWIYE